MKGTNSIAEYFSSYESVFARLAPLVELKAEKINMFLISSLFPLIIIFF
jgi:hypothetical protein